ncbi:MAG: pyruvate kinase [Myxococcota bacterium]
MSRSIRVRKTKVIATIGPACDSPETIAAMIEAGMNVARLNFSHGSHEEHHVRLQMIRRVSRDLDANVAVLLDTKGVEIRTGPMQEGGVDLEIGNDFTLYDEERLGDASGVSLSHPSLSQEVGPGAAILLSDGMIELRVVETHPTALRCEVVRGGLLNARKGVNLPGTNLSLPIMSNENRADLLFAVAHDIVYVAASFVRSAADIREIRHFLAEHDAHISIIAKIETAEAVANLDEIVAESNGVMVARGDLGVELPLQEIPSVQKKIIHTTVTNGKPVITATQMLDSMERQLVPTRAEVSDVANAILDGTSAVMLSGETAIGAHPVAAVRTMATLAMEAERSLAEYGHLQQVLPEPTNLVADAVSHAAIAMATHLEAAAILVLTETGFTVRAISKYRPACAILGITASPDVARRFAMNWGVAGVLCEASNSNDEMLQLGIERGRSLGYLESGDLVVATAGMHGGTGTTDSLRVLAVD